ncbi:hypothetical protein [Prochlorococcus marinus]|nr:hypothetical protein [Prochlorococcus marinus]
MNQTLEAFDDFLDDCLLANDPICTFELDLLAAGILKEGEESYKSLYTA